MVIRRDTSLGVNFRVEPPVKNSVYFNKYYQDVCVVVEYDLKYGWFIVEYSNGRRVKYSSSTGNSYLFRKATKEEYADYRLSQANRSIDDSWSER